MALTSANMPRRKKKYRFLAGERRKSRIERLFWQTVWFQVMIHTVMAIYQL